MGWYAVLRGILLAGAAVLLLGGTGNAALAQNGEAASPSLHGLQLGVGLSAGRPYLLGDMGDAWRGLGAIGIGLGPDVTLDYFGDRVGVGLALEFMPTHVGGHSARAISGAFMLHWRPGPARTAWQPTISVGYARFYLAADAVRVSELTGNAADIGTGADPYILGNDGRVALRMGHNLVKHFRIVLRAQADAVILENSLHAVHFGFQPELGVDVPTELRSAGWAIFPQVGIELQWQP